MVIEPSEAILIREAASRVLKGESLYAICSDWTSREIRSPQGKEWRSGVLRKLLEAPRIAGFREYHREVVGPAAWPAIIDDQMHANLRAKFSDANRRHGGRPPRHLRLLSGIAQCGLCERTLFSGVANGQRYYVCRSVQAKGGCGRIGIAAEPVDKYVVKILFDELSRRSSVDAAKRSDERLPLLRLLEADRSALDALALRFYVDRNITQREHAKARNALLSRIEDTERRLAVFELEERRVIDRREWSKLAISERRDFLRLHLSRLIIKPAVRGRRYIDLDRIEIEFRDER
jgi:hypothetical protein